MHFNVTFYRLPNRVPHREHNNSVYCEFTKQPTNQGRKAPDSVRRSTPKYVEVRRKLLRFLRLHYASPVIRIDNLPYMLGGIH